MGIWSTLNGILHHGNPGRWRLGGIAPGVLEDEAVTKAQLDAAGGGGGAPVPFAFSALLEIDGGLSPVSEGNVQATGIMAMLPFTLEVPKYLFENEIRGFVFYLDTQRGSYWGDIVISVDAPPIFTVDIKLATIGTTECNSLVVALVNSEPVVGETYTLTVTASAGDFAITRTLTITVAEEE